MGSTSLLNAAAKTGRPVAPRFVPSGAAPTDEHVQAVRDRDAAQSRIEVLVQELKLERVKNRGLREELLAVQQAMLSSSDATSESEVLKVVEELTQRNAELSGRVRDLEGQLAARPRRGRPLGSKNKPKAPNR